MPNIIIYGFGSPFLLTYGLGVSTTTTGTGIRVRLYDNASIELYDDVVKLFDNDPIKINEVT